ncbi:hypothetical protein [Oceanispirochaeta sp. M1]|uniref:hypothetical protein n=2 Tax=Oceanispirochaeta TaxID=2035349 RepID=UPI00149533FB|nr:hypothetical protein [Oceanispirochaeta sp. M1]
MPKVLLMIRKAGIPLLLSVLILFSGCSKIERNIKVYSDRAEVAELVNLFNQSQSQYTAVFIYKTSGSEEGSNPGNQDIVISSGLHSSFYKEKLSGLNSLRKKSFVQSIYPELLKTGISDTTLKTIPLSVSLPLVISGDTISEGKYTSWKDLSRYAADFNVLKEDSLIHSGFSPPWSKTFLTAYFNNRIDSFRTELNKNNFQEIRDRSQELLAWIIETNGSLEMCRAFSKKYRYIPDYRLIMNGRIALSVIPLEEWALLPDSITRELNAEILKFEDGVQSIGILSAGIPLQSENQAGALFFLNWLLEDSTWEDYLTIVSRNRDESFGFLNGISASEKLNTDLLPRYYPWMKSHTPRAGEFASQTEIESQWTQVWTELFLPLVLESVTNSQFSKDFSNEYRKWLLQNPDPWE